MRSVSALFSDAWSLFQAHMTLFVGVYAVPVAATILFEIFFTPETGSPQSLQTVGMMLIALAAALIVSILGSLALILCVLSPEGKTIEGAYRDALQYFFPFLFLSILIGIVVMIGFVLLIIPGVIFLVWFLFAPYILLVEGKKGTDAMKASREYVKGHWWAVFGRILAFMLVFMVVGGVAAFVGEMLTAGLPDESGQLAQSVISGLLNLIIVPFSTAYMYYMYRDLSTASPEAAPSASSSTDNVSEPVPAAE